MGVQLNIKDEATVRMARELADRRGVTITAVVHNALKREYDEQDGYVQDRIRMVDALVAEFQRNLPAEWRKRTSTEIMDAIYDDEQEDGFAK